uniref:Uncharacterized protein n=1 Tax=Anguilla anguilla TaxID=7936 RepID=A0A0E9WXB5_ANGAN
MDGPKVLVLNPDCNSAYCSWLLHSATHNWLHNCREDSGSYHSSDHRIFCLAAHEVSSSKSYLQV